MKASDRIVKALQSGWSFGELKLRDSVSLSRNYLWVENTIVREGWYCNKRKSTGDGEKDLHALLDEAGVPEYE